MTEIKVVDGNLIVEVEGWDKFWSLRSHLTIPAAHVSKVYADPEIAKPWWKGLRVGGAQIPGVVTAGTFYHHHNWIFWDVHHAEKTVVIDLHHEHYAKLIVEVADPAETVARLQRELGKS